MCACWIPWWQQKACTGHKSTQAQDRMRRGVHQAGLDSTPEACKCTRGHSQHTGREEEKRRRRRWFYRIRVLALCSCADKKERTGPELWIYDRPLRSDLYLSCIRQGVGGWVQLWGLVWTFEVNIWGLMWLKTGELRHCYQSTRGDIQWNIFQTIQKFSRSTSYNPFLIT